MQLHNVTREHAQARPKIVGRGGKRGKTSGKGTKGQRARSGHRIRPAIRDVIKKLPKLRGHGARMVSDVKPVVINIALLDKHFTVGEVISPKTLFAKGLVNKVSRRLPPIKLLGRGTMKQKLVTEGVTLSASAKKQLQRE
jgi:large subunit ribosomal protein L15